MKYIIDIPDNTHWIQWIMEGTKDHHPYMNQKDVEDLTPYTEPDRKAIEDEVWEFVSDIECMTVSEVKECFCEDYDGVPFVASAFTYSEAKARYEAWKKKKDEIRVGDEVEYTSCDETMRFIVTGIVGERVYGFNHTCEYDDAGGYCDIDMLRKTGRHFDEVEELLKKMKGENNETGF